ncbi:MAG TPA: TIGR00299 family protein [Ktedonobacter sp.]|nr:TIGR00299 family protein [Ktedonobacter sp.]
MGQRILYLDCHSGISGNMFLGALLDAGLSFDVLQATLRQAFPTIESESYELVFEPFSDKGIRGTHFDVKLHEKEHPARTLRDISTLLHSSSLPVSVRDTALAIFHTLGEAEAHVHGVSLDEIHFHEVGAIDAIIDITGAALALHELQISRVYASPLPLTHGHAHMAHGMMPLPAPATLEILRRVQAPWTPCPIEGELVTPTGAAILATLAHFETPSIIIEQVGYGFGRKQFPWPNCLRVCIGTSYSLHSPGEHHVSHSHTLLQ